ncbi:conserved hypothetical protein [Verticillium alfalfae VaMs.102]|uniref:Allantoate permease n=1 Tax=Verticillium alfalfae (strain VaMs.102 / ATCC MYA-4576 / FGSC 10136) TaxID=526221 RepID=C9S8G6_VERA1|nr:conserved hypothetical protein [Verticillium alfalfae VaMs.102]EEY15356.1 conserved hypothetical protein [Verticillium alfalfae VaMs.102]
MSPSAAPTPSWTKRPTGAAATLRAMPREVLGRLRAKLESWGKGFVVAGIFHAGSGVCLAGVDSCRSQSSTAHVAVRVCSTEADAQKRVLRSRRSPADLDVSSRLPQGRRRSSPCCCSKVETNTCTTGEFDSSASSKLLLPCTTRTCPLTAAAMGTEDIETHDTPRAGPGESSSLKGLTDVQVGRSELSDAIPPDHKYEGRHRWDPTATWTEAEEKSVIRKTDLCLLTWLCVMFFGLQLDRGNLSNALADDFLTDMNLTSDDYNNGTTIQLVAFLAAEFPVQLLTKRYGFRYVLPTMMFAWGTVSWAQAWMHNRTGFYITRALIGFCEGGFIPGAILFATYFYTSKELSIRLAAFCSNHFNERTFHCFVGEFWVMPLLIALLTISDGGQEWARFTLVTLISGYPYFHPIVTSWISENTFDVKKRAIAAATYNVIVQMGSLIGSQIYRSYDGPYFKQGNKVLVSICAFALVVFVAQRQVIVYLNGKKEKKWAAMSDEDRHIYQNDVQAREVDGNKRLDFRYTY